MADERQAHNFRIFLASFLTIFTNGVAFAVRGSILNDWAEQFGFTKTELGTITGGGLWGFGLIIILSSLVLDKIGYKPMLLLGFLMHLLSGVITLAASYVFASYGKDATFQCLNIGMILFAVGNGLCEGAVNPLVADLYPKQKTHYLNILHASWPAGLIVGGLLAYCFTGFMGKPPLVTKLHWEYPLGTFLIPVLIYGVLVLSERLPVTSAKAAGVSVGEMLSQFAAPLLLMLVVLHAMVGYVELGTDSWIMNIMGNVIKDNAILLFIYTSALMFVARFFAGPIVERINPLGLLTVSSIMAVIGLTLLSTAEVASAAFVAGTIYGLGKTFFWPTMLGVAGERFPRGGAVVMGVMGGVGMLSAGLLGGPGIGYKQDRFASQQLKEVAPASYERYAANDDNRFLFFEPIRGLNGAKVGVLENQGADVDRDFSMVEKGEIKGKLADDITALHQWWTDAKTHLDEDTKPVQDSSIHGGREALRITSFVPATMAVVFFLMVLYFRFTGGYKQLHLHGEPEGPSEF